jgi:hypothetical protein
MRQIEVYCCFVDNTWDTFTVNIPLNTPRNSVTEVAMETMRQLSKEWNPKPMIIGIFHVPQAYVEY